MFFTRLKGTDVRDELVGVEKHPYVPLFFTKRDIWDGPDRRVLEKPDMLREL